MKLLLLRTAITASLCGYLTHVGARALPVSESLTNIDVCQDSSYLEYHERCTSGKVLIPHTLAIRSPAGSGPGHSGSRSGGSRSGGSRSGGSRSGGSRSGGKGAGQPEAGSSSKGQSAQPDQAETGKSATKHGDMWGDTPDTAAKPGTNRGKIQNSPPPSAEKVRAKTQEDYDKSQAKGTKSLKEFNKIREQKDGKDTVFSKVDEDPMYETESVGDTNPFKVSGFSARQWRDLGIDDHASYQEVGVYAAGKGKNKKPPPTSLNAYSKDQETIIALSNMKEHDPHTKESPEKSFYSSELMYQTWEKVAGNDASSLRFIIRPKISNEQTTNVIKHIFKNLKVDEKQTLTLDAVDGNKEREEAYKAIIGTPNGNAGMRMVMDHYHALGKPKSITLSVWSHTPAGAKTKDATWPSIALTINRNGDQ